MPAETPLATAEVLRVARQATHRSLGRCRRREASPLQALLVPPHAGNRLTQPSGFVAAPSDLVKVYRDDRWKSGPSRLAVEQRKYSSEPAGCLRLHRPYAGLGGVGVGNSSL